MHGDLGGAQVRRDGTCVHGHARVRAAAGIYRFVFAAACGADRESGPLPEDNKATASSILGMGCDFPPTWTTTQLRGLHRPPRTPNVP